MNKRLLITILVFIVAGGIYFLYEPSMSDLENATSGAPEVQREDTLKDDRPEYAQEEQFSPGTAKVLGTVQNIEKLENNKIMLTFRADNVLGYGSATPPIGSRASLSINATSYFNAQSIPLDSYSKGDELYVLISSSIQPSLGDSDTGKKTWTLEKIYQ